jgi:WD40 repeat protein
MSTLMLKALAGLALAAGVLEPTPGPGQAAQQPGVRVFKTHGQGRACVALAPDGKTLAAGGGYGTIRLWDVATGREKPPLREQGAGWVNAMAFAEGGKTLISGGDDKTVRLWDLATGRVTRRLEVAEGVVDAVSVAPDGKTLAAAGRRLGTTPGGIHTWDLATGKPLRSFGRARSWTIYLPFTPDSKQLASGGEGFTAYLWDVATGREVRTFEHPKPPAGPLSGRARKLDLVLGLTLAPDGKTLATGDNEGMLRLWELSTGKQRRQIPTGGAGSFGVFAVCALAYAPDGRTLASAGGDGTIRLWEVATGKLRGRLKGSGQTVWSLAFSPDGRLLASGSHDGTARLWDVAAGVKAGN